VCGPRRRFFTLLRENSAAEASPALLARRLFLLAPEMPVPNKKASGFCRWPECWM
jgi:hypothetical protein